MSRLAILSIALFIVVLPGIAAYVHDLERNAYYDGMLDVCLVETGNPSFCATVIKRLRDEQWYEYGPRHLLPAVIPESLPTSVPAPELRGT